MFVQRVCIYYCCSPGSPSFTLTLIDLNSFSLKEQEELDERPEIWGSEGEPEDDFDDESEGENVDTGFAIKSLTAFIHLLFVWQMAFVVSDNCLKILLAIIGYNSLWVVQNLKIARKIGSIAKRKHRLLKLFV